MLASAPLLALALFATAQEDTRPFCIQVVDKATGRGVPLVELRTTNEIRFVTDSNGLVAFDEPGLMDQTVFFYVSGHGYTFPKDGFGIQGKALEVKPGGTARLEVERVNIAERLYRVTGGGIYRDSVLLGRKPPTRNPVLNAKVHGQDSVMTVVRGGKVLWFWGDTGRPAYPLGDFDCPGATSLLPADGGLDPAVGVDLEYYKNPETGFARGTAKMPGSGPTWISGLANLPDTEAGADRLYGSYVKIRPPLEAYQHGLIVWDDAENRFEQLKLLPEGQTYYPEGHTFVHADPSGAAYLYFARPYPYLRVKADAASYCDPARYEGYTCLKAGSDPKALEVERGSEGALVYGWKPATAPLDPDTQDKLLKAGKIRPEEAILALRDVETGKPVRAHGGSVAWNEHRKAWVMVFVQIYGESSMLGEVWFAEAQAIEGPWVYARKVVTHSKYSFYNPKHHAFFDQEGGRLIYFEGTYTMSFSGNDNPTPRYDYNQVMYRLDLDDPRLNLPVPVRLPGATRSAFFVRPRPGQDTVPITVAGQVVGHGLRTDAPPPATAEALYEATAPDGSKSVLLESEPTPAGHRRSETPGAYVWTNPLEAPRPASR